MLQWLWHAVNTFGLHPLNGPGYQWWSGEGSVFTPKDLAALGFVVAWWHAHNCHVHRCPRLQWHPHPEHGHPVCKHHHPHDATALEAGR